MGATQRKGLPTVDESSQNGIELSTAPAPEPDDYRSVFFVFLPVCIAQWYALVQLWRF
jgi:hypothetical protein